MLGAMTEPALHRLSPEEARGLARDGYLVRERVIAGGDLERLQKSCEELVARLVARPLATPRVPAGSYVFQVDPELATVLKWEPEHPDVVMGIEPFAHFDAELRAWGEDARLADPIRDLLGFDEVELFTEKLNVKRARVGGPIVLHQDYPYWVANSENAAEIATAVVFLDDAHRGNGGLEVLPGSHTAGPREGGARSGFGKFEMKPDAIDPRELVALEVPAGSVVWFGSLLVHRSQPNRSGGDRRTLLYSYQPAGRAPSVDSLIELLRR
jgi:ectoine hydroxylase